MYTPCVLERKRRSQRCEGYTPFVAVGVAAIGGRSLSHDVDISNTLTLTLIYHTLILNRPRQSHHSLIATPPAGICVLIVRERISVSIRPYSPHSHAYSLVYRYESVHIYYQTTRSGFSTKSLWAQDKRIAPMA